MNHFLPAVCYHPTTVVFIDDNQNFLQNIRFDLDCAKAAYSFFNDPMAALKTLEKYSFDPFPNRCSQHIEDEIIDRPTLEFDLRKIHRETHNPKRFAEISTIVIDYAMPQLNGLELCKRLKNLPVKKIMLTCEADEKLAVKAFNAGIIDLFIRKDADNFTAVINNAIYEMQLKYFHDLSQGIANSLKKSEYQSPFLHDPVFRTFFDETFKSLQATEYYVMDGFGSFMFLDINGKPSWLAVKNDAEMESFVDFTQYDKTPPEITKALKERSKIPYFHTDKELEETAAPQWGAFLYPAQKLVGNLDTYYYAIITDSRKYKIGKITSFADFSSCSEKA